MSFLAQMLMTTVIPLKDREPACQANQRKSQRSGPHIRSTMQANAAAHAQAVARYRGIMGDEWVPTPIIESRLALSRSSCSPNLNKWMGMGLVEKRKIGKLENWTKRIGYEWRFVK